MSINQEALQIPSVSKQFVANFGRKKMSQRSCSRNMFSPYRAVDWKIIPRGKVIRLVSGNLLLQTFARVMYICLKLYVFTPPYRNDSGRFFPPLSKHAFRKAWDKKCPSIEKFFKFLQAALSTWILTSDVFKFLPVNQRARVKLLDSANISRRHDIHHEHPPWVPPHAYWGCNSSSFLGRRPWIWSWCIFPEPSWPARIVGIILTPPTEGINTPINAKYGLKAIYVSRNYINIYCHTLLIAWTGGNSPRGSKMFIFRRLIF